MERNGFSEEEAHRYIQKRSMDNGTELVEVSQMILSLMQEGWIPDRVGHKAFSLKGPSL